MARFQLSLIAWCVFATCLGGGLAWAGESAEGDGQPVAGGSEKAEVDPLEALRAAWHAAPTSIGCGIRYQDAMRAAGLARQVEAEFRKRLAAARDDAALAFLHGRVKGGSAGIEAMRAALARRLGRAAGDDSGLLEAWIALAVMEVSAGNADPAAQAGTMIVTLRGGAADWTYLGWIHEHMRNDPAAALRAYASALEKDPDHLRARNALSLLKASAGDKRGARALAEGSVEKNPADASAHLHLGLVLALAGDKARAGRAYAEALRCAPEDPDTLTSIAAAYMDIEEHALAGRALRRALDLDPGHARTLTTAGLLALARGKDKDARALMKRAAKSTPRDSRIAFLEAACAERLGLHASAIAGYRRAMKLAPERVEYVSALALVLRKKGSLTASVQKFKQAIEMAPGDAELRLQLGITAMKQRKYRDARDAFRQAVERAPKLARPHFYLAIIYGDHMSRPKDALASLEQYKALGGKEPTALAWLAQLEQRLGTD